MFGFAAGEGPDILGHMSEDSSGALGRAGFVARLGELVEGLLGAGFPGEDEGAVRGGERLEDVALQVQALFGE